MTDAADRTPTLRRRFGAVWGVLGVALILLDAVVRVWPYSQDAVRHGLSATQWALMGVWVMVMLVADGYRGFQRQFSPRVAARARQLHASGRGMDLVLAPLYCVGYFHAPRRQVISSWALTGGIVLLVVAVRAVDQPWRGMIDAGVLAGLAYGLASVVVCAIVSRGDRSAEAPGRGPGR